MSARFVGHPKADESTWQAYEVAVAEPAQPHAKRDLLLKLWLLVDSPHDPDLRNGLATQALLDFIDDPEIAAAYEELQ